MDPLPQKYTVEDIFGTKRWISKTLDCRRNVSEAGVARQCRVGEFGKVRDYMSQRV